MCAYAHDFRQRLGCALIGACALIRTNTVTGLEIQSKFSDSKADLSKLPHFSKTSACPENF